MSTLFDTGTKLSLVFLLISCAFALPTSLTLSLVVLVFIVERFFLPFRASSDSADRVFLKSCVVGLAFLLVVVSVNGVLVEGQAAVKLGSVVITKEGIDFGLTIGARVVLLSLSILMFFVSTPLREFSKFLQDFGISDAIIAVLLLSLHFIEQLPNRIEQIFTAQEARGAPVRANIFLRTRTLVSILYPLILSSMVESVDRGMALELRGFSSVNLRPTAKTAYRRPSFLSILFLSLALALLIHSGLRWLLK